MKLEDLLHKSNPWQGLDCNRELCLLCKTKETTGKNKGQECTKRLLVYEFWCLDCEREEEERVKRESGEDEKLMEELRKGIRIYKYIGETARSIYKRALEHKIAMDSLSSGSYMLKHCIDRHDEKV